jgi:fumarylacetoacetase
LPIGYHGRSGTVVVSGTPIRRPWGQHKVPTDPAPTFAPSGRLDVEVEVGLVVGVGTELGQSVSVSAFPDHVFGACLLNDWSARDIQAFEYVPLGPFLGKSFATSISPWIVPLAALERARCTPPPRDVPLQDYLADTEPWGLDLRLELECNRTILSRPRFATMYWTGAQQLAHMTVNGASLRCGDLYASGTVSGPAEGQWGSLLELAWRGEHPLRLRDGGTRVFLHDGDQLVVAAAARGAGGAEIGFGSVEGTVLPAPTST